MYLATFFNVQLKDDFPHFVFKKRLSALQSIFTPSAELLNPGLSLSRV